MTETFLEMAQKFGLEIKTFSETTRTSQDAADAVGCELGQIGKSIIFKSSAGQPVLVIISGLNRVDINKLGQLIGEQIEKADADFVYEATGYPIGGVTPFGHKTAIQHIFIDNDLLQYKTIWCAGGTPHTVFEIAPQKLIEAAKAKVTDIKQ